MSFSENSTLRPFSRDSSQQLDDDAHGVGAFGVNSYAQSPYTDPDLFSLDVGPDKVRFRVHRMILSQSPELEVKPSGMLWGERTSDSIALPDLDEPTAHTLVHYLYSGRYQTLKPFDSTSLFKGGKARAVAAYAHSTCVYCAAMRYKLPGLAELAKERIASYADELSIVDILGVARDHAFPSLPTSESWYPGYLQKAIKDAAAQDPGLFMQPEFVDQIEGDRRYRQVVMSAIVSTYSGNGSGERQHTGVSTPATEARPEESLGMSTDVTSPVEHEHERLQEAIAAGDRGILPDADAHLLESVKAVPEDTAATAEGTEGTELNLDEIEPSVPASPAEPEPFTDELGFAKSKTYQKLGKRGDSAIVEDVDEILPVVNKKDVVVPPRQRTDSAMQANGNGTNIGMEKLTSTLEQLVSTVVNGDGTTTSTGKKNKKKKKKASTNATIGTIV